MSLKVTGTSGEVYIFEGPYTNTKDLEDRSGVYLITCFKNNTDYILDVGESKEVKSRIETHDRKGCWSENCDATVRVSVLYTPHKQQEGRMVVEQDIRDNYDFSCGIR